MVMGGNEGNREVEGRGGKVGRIQREIEGPGVTGDVGNLLKWTV